MPKNSPLRLVRLLEGLQVWLEARRQFDHEKWLRKHGRVTYTWPRTFAPHHSARRNGTEAVTR